MLQFLKKLKQYTKLIPEAVPVPISQEVSVRLSDATNLNVMKNVSFFFW